MFDTSSQSFQRQDDQEVDAHSFMFLSSPKQTKCTLDNDVIHHCKHETIISCSTRFWYYNFLLSLFQLRRIEMVTDLRISYWNNFYFAFQYHLFYIFMLLVNRYLAINIGVWLITKNRIAVWRASPFITPVLGEEKFSLKIQYGIRWYLY
jgi:hypothetical protein